MLLESRDHSKDMITEVTTPGPLWSSVQVLGNNFGGLAHLTVHVPRVTPQVVDAGKGFSTNTASLPLSIPFLSNLTSLAHLLMPH